MRTGAITHMFSELDVISRENKIPVVVASLGITPTECPDLEKILEEKDVCIQ